MSKVAQEPKVKRVKVAVSAPVVQVLVTLEQQIAALEAKKNDTIGVVIAQAGVKGSVQIVGFEDGKLLLDVTA